MIMIVGMVMLCALLCVGLYKLNTSDDVDLFKNVEPELITIKINENHAKLWRDDYFSYTFDEY